MLDLELPSTTAAPAAARGALEEIADALSADRMRDVRLLVSELVTNAVRHAEGAVVRLIVSLRSDVLRVEVHDPGRGFKLKEPPRDPLRCSRPRRHQLRARRRPKAMHQSARCARSGRRSCRRADNVLSLFSAVIVSNSL